MTPNPSYREIPLTQGKVAIVSAHRYEYLSQFKWTAFFTKGKWYACRSTSTKGGVKSRRIFMHREILGSAVACIQTDHINGDGLDNRDENLRPASVSQNQINRYSSDSRGIRRDGARWEARIGVDCQEISLGKFDTEHDARIAYAVAARLLHGKFRHITVPRIEQNEVVAPLASE